MDREIHPNRRNRLLQKALWLFLLPACLGVQAKEKIENRPNGVQLDTQEGKLAVEFVSEDIVRIRFTKAGQWTGNGTIVCLPRTPEDVNLRRSTEGNTLRLASDSLKLDISLSTGSIAFFDARTGQQLLSEEAAAPYSGEKTYIEKVTYDESTRRKEETANGVRWIADVARRDTLGTSWKYRIRFDFSDAGNLYGLGSHMEDYMNLRGKKMYLCQHNLKAVVPVLVSSNGYGLLFDAGCSMLFDNEAGGEGCMELEAAPEIDFYFMKGSRIDQVVARYRELTGHCPMLPKYMFGYIQSKERYKSSEELISVVEQYRRLQIPLDLIVQDWNYWPQGWGYIKMDPRYYPDLKHLTDTIHAMNAKLMVSIWPNPSNCPQADDFREKGYLLESELAYDAFSQKARDYYWQYVDREFFQNGFDAWWCDCTEPVDADWAVMPEGYGWDSHEERWQRNTQLLNETLGAERANLYSLYHSKGIYENQRNTSAEKRVANLTRSSYAGQQRYSTITWNGDTYASWQSFARQIPAGLNFMATGCPYWTVDAGAFFTRKSGQWFWDGDFPQGVSDLGYREFYTRMLQYATFLPLMRSHGTDTPREIWRFGKEGEPFYEAIASSIRLRYRLLPYIYSLAGQVTQKDYTPARLLAFDFPHDPKVFDLKDEYMFGPALLVCPVTEPMYYGPGSQALDNTRKSRKVYLPAEPQWIDFWSGAKYEGGQTLAASAPIERIPLYVAAGSIIPMGPVVQYTGEQNGKTLTLHIYPGRNAEFQLYEDEGDNYNYEEGRFATIGLKWNDSKQTLTLGRRSGSYEGMGSERDFEIVLHREGEKHVQQVHYTGKELACKF